MITNCKITYYHRKTNPERWQREVFNDVWLFGGQGSNQIDGYENANVVDVRIPMNYVSDLALFNIGDIIAVGETGEIEKQSDLRGEEFYNVTSIKINRFGYNPHVHLGGK